MFPLRPQVGEREPLWKVCAMWGTVALTWAFMVLAICSVVEVLLIAGAFALGANFCTAALYTAPLTCLIVCTTTLLAANRALHQTETK